MTLSMPVLIVAAGLWLVLFVGCILFAVLAMRMRASFITQHVRAHQLEKQLQQLTASNPAAGESGAGEGGQDESAEIASLRQTITRLEARLADAEDAAAAIGGKEDTNLVSRLRLDKLNEKYDALQSLWESTNQDLIRAEAKIAELLGVKAALEKERDMLERQIENLSEQEADNDSTTMREVIINFTEESRELLKVIEDLSAEKVRLEQQIADMEEGGKGTAGKVIGLQRKLDEAEAQIAELQS